MKSTILLKFNDYFSRRLSKQFMREMRNKIKYLLNWFQKKSILLSENKSIYKTFYTNLFSQELYEK